MSSKVREPRTKGKLRRYMEQGALVTLAIVGYALGLWFVAGLIGHIWEPLGWATFIAGFGGAIGAFVYFVERSFD